MRSRTRSALFFALCVLASCGDDSHAIDGGGTDGGSRSRPASSPHASDAGSAGHALETSRGAGVSHASCGSARCTANGTLTACCVDAATATCGVEDQSVGIACGVPAVADPRCPTVSVDFAGQAFVFQGCCTAAGICGGFNLGSPCAVVSTRDDDDAGVSPQRCD